MEEHGSRNILTKKYILIITILVIILIIAMVYCAICIFVKNDIGKYYDEKKAKLEIINGRAIPGGDKKKLLGAIKVSLPGAHFDNYDILLQMPNVKCLNLRRSNIHDLSVLRNMSSMEELDISFTNIIDIAPVLNNHRLKMLYMRNTNVEKLNGLKILRNLEMLDAGYCEYIVNIDSFPESIKTLDLSGCVRLDNLSSLKYAPHVKHLYLHDSGIRDISFLFEKNEIELLDLSNCSSLHEYGPLERLTNVKILNLQGDNIKDISLIAKMKNIEVIYLDNCQNILKYDILLSSEITNIKAISLRNTNCPENIIQKLRAKGIKIYD